MLEADMKKTKTKGTRSKTTQGIGAKGSRSRPAVDEGPKWRGGGKKGENEQRAG
jgi:hypothetical protein